MQFSELVHRSILRRAAQRYASEGWHVVPGAVFNGERYSCGPLCPTVSCHPAVTEWESIASARTSDVDGWWTNAPLSVLLATGRAFDVIEVPARVGLPAARTNPLGPVAVLPTGRWMFFVQPGDALRPELAARLDVVMHGTGSWIPAPPTRTREGRVRWDVHPSATQWRLPDAYAVQKGLVANLRPVVRAATFATTTPGFSRAA